MFKSAPVGGHCVTSPVSPLLNSPAGIYAGALVHLVRSVGWSRAHVCCTDAPGDQIPRFSVSFLEHHTSSVLHPQDCLEDLATLHCRSHLVSTRTIWSPLSDDPAPQPHPPCHSDARLWGGPGSLDGIRRPTFSDHCLFPPRIGSQTTRRGR